MKTRKRIKKYTDPFKKISDDVLSCELLPYLNYKEILKISTTNKQINKICDNSMIWKNVCLAKFSKRKLEDLNFYYSDLQTRNEWKQIFQRLLKASKYFQKEYEEMYKILELFNNKVNSLNQLFNFNSRDKTIEMISKKNFAEDIKKFQRLILVEKIVPDYFKYFGEMCDGKFDGKGTLIYEDGDKYVGNFKDGIRNGKGIYYYNDGRYYKGGFLNGLSHGKGIEYCDYGYFEGKWENDNIIESGKHFFKNGFVNERFYKDGLVDGNYTIKDNNGQFIFDGIAKENDDNLEMNGILLDEDKMYQGKFSNCDLNNLLLTKFSGIISSKKDNRFLMGGDWINGVNMKYPNEEKLHFCYCDRCVKFPINGEINSKNIKNIYILCNNCILEKTNKNKN